MYHVGMDVHWQTTTICILNEYGQQIQHKRIGGSWQRGFRFLAGIDEPYQVVYEVSCGCGFLCDRLSKMARRVVVAHPGHLRLVFRSKRKNDRIDPEKLAKLLYLGEIPPAYVPLPDIRE